MYDSLDDFFAHIQQLHAQNPPLGLDRIRQVAERLSLTQFSVPVIVIVGTNGKGSIAKTLESIYQQAGFKTALYTSPHLMAFNERIRINNQNIDDDLLLQAFSEIEKGRHAVALRFFEYITLAALYLFQQANCDVIILEAGLGGRFDAVNVVENDVAVIASIGLDHMDLLGDTREAIAFEKASVARKNKIVICAEEDPPLSIAKTVAEQKGILFLANRDYFYTINETVLSCHGKNFCYNDLPKPVLKAQNVAAAIAVVSTLQKQLAVSESQIAQGVLHTQWKGRFEKVDKPFSCILDVAHNADAATWLAEQYRALPKVQNTIAIVGMLKDKAMIETIFPLLSEVTTWFVCDLSNESHRGSDGSLIETFLISQEKHCKTFASVADAMYSLAHAFSEKKCDRALIFGSFYTVSAAKQWFLEQEKT